MFSLSLRPLCALRMALREWDTFFLGTASTIGGSNSHSDWRVGKAKVKDDHENVRHGGWRAR